jgi:UDP-glucose 4-epimerase
MMVEQVLHAYEKAYNFSFISLRYFNSCGAFHSYGEDHRPESHLIPRILAAATKSKLVDVYGSDYDTRDGTCIRDYIHVVDIAQAHILSALYLCRGGSSDCINLGTGKGFSVLEVIKCTEKVVGKPIEYRLSSKREGDSPKLVASREKAQLVLGWEPKHLTLEEIIQSAWNWKKQNPDGYDE